MRPSLKPCPFCGGTDLEYQVGTEDREGTPTAVLCPDCGATGPWAYEVDGQTTTADRLWNQRR